MATYQELFDLRNNQELLDKVRVAVIVAAETIYAEAGGVTNHANRLIWAREASIKPGQMAQVFMTSVLVANKSATVVNIVGAADAAIQTNVDNAVDDFANGTDLFSGGA